VPQTVGDHIRKRRLGMKLFQKDVAKQLAVHKTSIANWESNASQPDYQYMPAVIQFLGHNPLPKGRTWAERLIRHRAGLGITQGEAARRIGVDQGTLAKWERGEREPAGRFAERVEQFLAEAEAGRVPVIARTA